MERPELDKLIEGDTLIVTKLDRIARSMTQGSELVTELIKRGIRVYILNVGVMDNTPALKFIRNIFFAFAEFERDMIVERTKREKQLQGLRMALRREDQSDTQIDMALELLKNHSYAEIAKMTKISKSTLIRAMRGRKRNTSN